MRLLKRLTMAGLLAGFGVGALADNPISAYHYLADPGAASDGTYWGSYPTGNDVAHAKNEPSLTAAGVTLGGGSTT